MNKTPPPFAAALAAFSVLGVAFGYVAASAYLTHRLGGSAANPDLLYLGRNVAILWARAPTEFGVVLAIMGVGALLGLATVSLLATERLTRFGTTAWQTRREIERNGFLGEPGTGLILGKLGDPKDKAPFLVAQAFPHALVVAPTGRGKGVGFVVPNLLAFGGSVVVLDVKGENFRETARWRLKMKDTVIRFAPGDWSGTPSHRYNPLERIARIKNPAQQMMELRLTAGLFLQPDSPGTAGLLQGGIDLFVAAGMLAFQRGRPTLGEVYRIAVEGGDKQRAYLDRAHEVQFAPAKLIFTNLASINDRTLTSYLSLLLTSGLDTWSNPAIDAITATSDFSFRDVRRHRHAIYLEVAPEMVRPLAPLIRLFFSDLIASLQAREPTADERYRVLILLDEFDRLGRMPIVAESIKTLRSYGAHLALVTQTIPALDDIYGENTRLSIQGGAGVKVYLTPSDRKTIGELSASLGSTTRRVVSKSRPQGPHTIRARTLTERTEEAPLLTEDEVRTMDLDDVVLVIDAMNPIRARRIKYYEDRVLAGVHARQDGLPYPEAPETEVEEEDPSAEDDAPMPRATLGSSPGSIPAPKASGPAVTGRPAARSATAPLTAVTPAPVGSPTQVAGAVAASPSAEGPSRLAAEPSSPAGSPAPTVEAPPRPTRRGVIGAGIRAAVPARVSLTIVTAEVEREELHSLRRIDGLLAATPEASLADAEASASAAVARPRVPRPPTAPRAELALTPDPAWPAPASMLALREAITELRAMAEPDAPPAPELSAGE